jgi:hypothetical protein
MDIKQLPELIIGYEGSPSLMNAICSDCGEFMPNHEPLFPTSKENIVWFKAHFDQHMRRWHRVFEVSHIQ